MKRITKMIVSAMLIGALLAGLVFAQGAVATPPSTQTTPTRTVTPEIKDALLEALAGSDGEYAAYAMYSAVIDTYGDVEPYVTIR